MVKMKHKNRKHKLFRFIASVAAFSVAFTNVNEQPASADPGFCGVGVGTEVIPGGPGGLVVHYIVRNKCTRTYYFQAYDLQSPSYASYCLPIDGGGTRGLPMGTHQARNWSVRICKS